VNVVGLLTPITQIQRTPSGLFSSLIAAARVSGLNASPFR
jgi:hypothetical protein